MLLNVYHYTQIHLRIGISISVEVSVENDKSPRPVVLHVEG